MVDGPVTEITDIKIQSTAQPQRASFDAIIDAAIADFGANSKQAKILKAFKTWVAKIANPRVRSMMSSLEDAAPRYVQAFNRVVSEKCSQPKRATFDEIIEAAIQEFGAESKEAKVLKNFQQWVNKTANPKVRKLIAEIERSENDSLSKYKRIFDFMVEQMCAHQRNAFGVAKISPAALEIGAQTKLVVTGKNLPPDLKVEILSGTTVDSQVSASSATVSADQLQAEFTIAVHPAAVAGERTIRLFSPSVPNLSAVAIIKIASPSIAKIVSIDPENIIPRILSADGEEQPITIKVQALPPSVNLTRLKLRDNTGKVVTSADITGKVTRNATTGEITIGTNNQSDPNVVKIMTPTIPGTYFIVLIDDNNNIVAQASINVADVNNSKTPKTKLPPWVRSLRGKDSRLTLQVGNPANEGRDGIAKDDNYARGNFEKPLVGLSTKWAPELSLWDGALNVIPEAHGSFSYYLNYHDADGTRRTTLGVGVGLSTDKLRSYWGLDPQLYLAYTGGWYHENFRSPNQPVDSEGIFDFRFSAPFTPFNLAWLTLGPILAAQVRHSAYAAEITGSSFDAIRSVVEGGAWAKFALSQIWEKPGVPDITVGGSGFSGKRDVPDSLLGSWERKIGGYHFFAEADFQKTPWHPTAGVRCVHLEDGTRPTDLFFVALGLEPPSAGKFTVVSGYASAFSLSPLVSLETVVSPFLLDSYYTAGYDDSAVPGFVRVEWKLPAWARGVDGLSVILQYERQAVRGETRDQFSGSGAYDFAPIIFPKEEK